MDMAGAPAKRQNQHLGSCFTANAFRPDMTGLKAFRQKRKAFFLRRHGLQSRSERFGSNSPGRRLDLRTMQVERSGRMPNLRLVLSVVVLAVGLMLSGCDSSPEASGQDPKVETLLNQGPVSAWRIPIVGGDQGPIVCRYVVTGAEEPREYPVSGDSLLLTTVDQDGILTIVHTDRGSEGMATSVTFRIQHPLPGDVRVEGPYIIAPSDGDQTVWQKTWEAPETRQPVFSVQLVAGAAETTR